jgi:hypothetical protein
MRRDCDDRDLIFPRAVAPEDAIGARRSVLGVGFEDFLLFVVRIGDAVKFVGLEAGMTGVGS